MNVQSTTCLTTFVASKASNIIISYEYKIKKQNCNALGSRFSIYVGLQLLRKLIDFQLVVVCGVVVLVALWHK